MKVLTSVVASVVLSLSLLAGYNSYTTNYSHLRQATYQLRGDFGTCSAVAIAEGTLLSAAHCDQPGLTVDDKPVSVIKIDQTNDLLLLKGDVACPCVPVADAMPSIDSKVVVIGFPFGAGEIVTEGVVSDFFHILVERMPEFAGRLMITAPVEGGNSGGPVFQLGLFGWHVVGIVTNASTHHTIAPGVDKIKAFLNG